MNPFRSTFRTLARWKTFRSATAEILEQNFKKKPAPNGIDEWRQGGAGTPNAAWLLLPLVSSLTEPPAHTGPDCGAGAASHQASSLQAIIRGLAPVAGAPWQSPWQQPSA